MLPLSFSGALLGTMLAVADYHVDWRTVLFLFLTVFFLHILSNLNNEHKEKFRIPVLINMALAVVSGLVMIRFSFGTLFSLDSFVLMLLGYFAIRTAKRYAIGKSNYGRPGTEEARVMFLYGFAAVAGAYFVCSHSFGSWLLLLPCLSVGSFSVGVLNLHSINDIDGGMTLPARLGDRGSRIFHTALILTGCLSLTAYACLRVYDIWHFIFLLSLPLFVWHLTGVWKSEGQGVAGSMKLLVMSTFIVSLLTGMGFVMFLL